MPDHDHRPAIHATSTSALRAVAALLAVVLLLAVAMMALDALSTPPPPGTAAEHTEPVAQPVRHLVLIDVQPAHTAGDRQP